MIRKKTVDFSITANLLAGSSEDYYGTMIGGSPSDAVVATIDIGEGMIKTLAIQRAWVNSASEVGVTFHNFGGSTITPTTITVHVALISL